MSEVSEPRILEEHWDLNGEKLMARSVVISGGHPAIMQGDGTFMDHDGTTYDIWEMEYPLTVIWEPAA